MWLRRSPSGSPAAHQAAHQRRAPTRQGPGPLPQRPAQFRRATTVGGFLQLVHLAQLAASPLLLRRQPAKLPVMRQSIRTPGSHHQPGVRVVALMGHAGAWPLRARCPMRRTAQAQPVGAAPGPTAIMADQAAAQGPRQATSRPPQFRAWHRGRGYTSPCPHTSAHRTSPRHPSPGRPADVEAVAGTAAQVRTVPPGLPGRFRATSIMIGSLARRRCEEVHGVLRHGGSAACRAGMAR